MHTEEILKLKTIEDFWKRKLSGDLSNDLISCLEGSYLQKPEQKHIEVVSASFPEPALEKIRSMCNNSGVLIFNFHLSVLYALLARYREEGEATIGSPRFTAVNESGKDGIIFYRSAADPSKSFKELFGILKAEVLETINYQDIDYTSLVKPYTASQLGELGKISLSVLGVTMETGLLENFGLRIAVDGCNVSASFNANELDRELAGFFLHNYTTLLASILEDPYKPLNQLSFIHEKERELLLNEFQGKDKMLSFPTFVDCFEAQVLKTPQSIAIELNGRAWTYEQLNASANRLSHFIQSRQPLQKDDLVAIVMDRSPEMAQSILAVWKASAAYVPIDPAYPEERIKAILESSECRLILSSSNAVPDVVQNVLESFSTVVYLDRSAAQISSSLPANPGIAVQPGSLAYVIYTSGSTGKPKGVMIEHKGMMNHLEAKCSEMEIHAGSVVVQNAPQCFDISVWQFFAAMTVGGKTVVYDNDLVLDLYSFVERVNADGVTTLELVPSYLIEMQYVLDEMEDSSLFSKLNILILNAETLMPSSVQKWLSSFPHIRIVNTYGATEVSDDTSHYILDRVPDTATVPVMLRPIQNFHLYILNAQKELCPVGVKGEVYLSGFAVGRGYLNDPARTEASYMTDHLRSQDGVRMYRTGDIGRLLPDGRMEFFGRRDYQVKIRGHRVELGEIEHKLTGIPGVKNAVVVDRDSADGQKYLVGYVVADRPFTQSELSAKLREQLPEYMIPGYFIQIDSFPLTANGKINKKMLPDPGSEGIASATLPEPSTELETKLVSIWKELLNKDNIGIRDNFFEIGGHSLLVTKLVYRIHKELQVRLDLRSVFVNPTIEKLAAIIQVQDRSQFEEIKPLPYQDHYELSHAQKRLWILCQLENTSVAYNMHAAYMFNGLLDVKAFERSFETLIQRHESLRTVFITAAGEPRQRILKPEELPFALEVIDISREDNREIEAERISNEEALIPFDLTKGPLIRARLVKLDADRYVFLFTMHHIISDGWSMEVLVNEVLGAYNLYSRGQENRLSPLRIQYKDYAAWQNLQLSGDKLKEHQDYWKSQFTGDLPILELPYDKPRPKVQTFNGSQTEFVIGKELSDRLNRFARGQDTTLFASLLSAVNALLYKYTGQSDIIVGSPIAGREHSDLEEQIGFYVNTLALRSTFEPSQSFTDLLTIVKEQTINAYDHQIYPFDKLVDDLNLQRDLSRSALFDVMVALQNNTSAQAKAPVLDGIGITSFTSKRMVSMFDFTISFAETEEGIHTAIEYNTDLFKAETIERMGRHFTALLDELLKAPSRPLSQVDYLSADEKRAWAAGDDTKSAFPETKTIIELFGEQVRRNPDGIALDHLDTTLSYAELDERSSRLASLLADKYGVMPQDIVAIQAERSPEFIVAILAALKLNAVYLPLDVSLPVERLDYVLEDSRARVLLGSSQGERTITPFLNISNISYSGLPVLPSTMPGKPSDIVYMIYTSGTTGKPKGVLIPNSALVNYVCWFTHTYSITEQDSTVLFSSLAFDLSYTVLWPALLSGARLNIMQELRHLDPSALLQLLAVKKVSFIKLTPSHFRMLVNQMQEPRTEPDLALRLIVLGGEPVQTEDMETYFRFDSKVTFVNHYGPTETTIGAVAATVTGDTFDAFRAFPNIGRPLHNTKVYILDNEGNPVPHGIAGELCIAGAGLARGYFNNDTLTAEKFVTLHTAGCEERVYRTGDLGRRLSDGSIALKGRKDKQVKVRGYRIELGEIESTLKMYEDIEEAVVIAEDDKSDKQLIAYVVPQPKASPYAAGMKRYKLPNNLAVAQLNKNETDYIYKEIFGLQAYIQHGVALKDGDCIFDVGSNIGLFSLFANTACKDPKLFCFEPNPEVYKVLSANTSLYCKDAKVFNCGLAEENKESEFTFFEGFSLLSGLYADAEVERDVVKTFMVNQQRKGEETMSELVSSADEILRNRFQTKKFKVRLEPLSDIIEREKVQRIDYLKINVEKAELDVLKGIRDEHWKIIRQIVLEVDVQENLPFIINLLESKGYDLLVEQDLLLEGTALCYIYAIRIDDGQKLDRSNTKYQVQVPVLEDQVLSDLSLKEFMRKKLPEYMIPSRFIQVENIPLTPNGKVSRKELSMISGIGLESRPEYVEASNDIESRLVLIWENVLGKEKIGMNDHFFEMGGNSLKVVELYRHIDQAYPDTVNVTNLFDNTTISRQAAFIASRLGKPSAEVHAEADEIREIEL